jgi:predicted aspartyl protease
MRGEPGALEPADLLATGRNDLWAGRLHTAIVHLTAAADGLEDATEAWRQLGWAHYHRNDFAAAADAFERAGAARAMVSKLRSFKTSPYAREGALPVVLPFVQTDPLPVVRLTLAGRDVYALIDTGGAELILDPGTAAEAGVETFGSESGTFAGGAKASYQHGRLGEVGFGGTRLREVPVHVLPTLRFSAVTAGKYSIEAILGTNMLAQFRPTLDYPAGKLVLAERRSGEPSGAAVPFILVYDHFMYAEGSLNGREGLTFLVDSGLAGGAFTGPGSTLARTGISVPDMLVTAGVGGGGSVQAAPFAIDELALGQVVERRLTGIFGPFPEGLGREVGCVGLISHGFLGRFRWTLDFDDYVYYVERPEA